MSWDEKKKKAALLLAFGCPETLADVEPFIRNIFKDKAVPESVIENIKERYSLIGGKSPLLDITRAQAKAIEEALNKSGKSGDTYKVYTAMRYSRPYIKDVLKEMRDAGYKDVIGLVMAPFNSPVSTGGYINDVEAASQEEAGLPQVFFVSDWHILARFVDAVMEKIDEAMAAFAEKDDVLVILSSHSLPMSALEGDAYEMKVQQTIDLIGKRLKADYKAAYQSKSSGPKDWLGPSVEDVMAAAKKSGKTGVLVVPLGFVSDHVETLYDIDILFRKTAESLGLVFKRSASLNTSPKLMGLLADLIRNRNFNYFY
ncbi:MAG: ferrochelatase [Deltaproteobacteria bacterium]|nr:ferrochelatase [Deltaproteobacteria bacterium]